MRPAWLVAVSAFAGAPVHGQSPMPSLPVSGTVIYNAIWYDQAAGTDARDTGLRFAGRIAVRVDDRTYVGLGIGSWVRRTGANCSIFADCGDLLDAQSEAVVHQLYAQRYVAGRAFVRAGAGFAITSTLQSVGIVVVNDRWRAALSAGVGIDLSVARFLYVTPSFDATLLPGTNREAQELRSGLALGLGLTVR